MFDSTPTISLETLNRIASIDEFKGRWASLGQLVPSRLKILQRVANMESVAAVCRMQGIRCSDRQIGEFINGCNVAGNFSLAEQHIIRGCHTVFKLVSESYEQVPFIDNHVQQMHDLLINSTTSLADQNQGVPEKLSHLIGQVNQQLSEGRLHPLLVFSDFSYRCWHIRPFQQGNKRLTWLLTQLLLLRHGYGFLAYGSLLRFIEKRFVLFQKNWPPSGGREMADSAAQGWLDMFLDALVELQDNIVAKINREKELLRLGTPHREIIRIIQENGQSTISQIMATTRMNRNTLKVRLRKLVAEQYLIQRGRGKATCYQLPELYLP